MKEWKRSNLPKEEIRQTIIAVIVEGGADFGFAWHLNGEQIERLENLLIEISKEIGVT